jgi:hypothetical protein
LLSFRLGVELEIRAALDEAVATQIVEQLARANFSAAPNDRRGVPAGFAQPEQGVDSISRAPGDP